MKSQFRPIMILAALAVVLVLGVFAQQQAADKAVDPVCGMTVVKANAKAEKPAVDARVQGLDPSPHHLGRAGVLRDLDKGDAGCRERGSSPAGGEETVPMPDEGLCELHEAGLVPD